MTDRLYLLLIGLADDIERCGEVLAQIRLVFNDDEPDEWKFGERQLAIISISDVSSDDLLNRRLATPLKHPSIAFAVLLEPREGITLPKAIAGFAGHLAARVRDFEKLARPAPLTRVPTQVRRKTPTRPS